VPQLKGIGLFIWLFGLGFISAKEAHPMRYAIGAFAMNALSCLFLCAAVALIMGRFIWL
jgi:hypothetical protein